jgi:hypothetical protein
MEIVIMAAGHSTRIGQDHRRHIPKKPFLDLGGESVIQRAVRVLRAAGAGSIKIAAGPNYFEARRHLGDSVGYLLTWGTHRDALRELGQVCRATSERSQLLVILGDLVYSVKAARQFLAPYEGDVVVFGSGPKEEYPNAWWNRGDEVFAVILKGDRIKQGASLYLKMKEFNYEWKCLAPHHGVPIIRVPECVDIDHYEDYIRAREILRTRGAE